MDLCSNGHKEVCFEAKECPACDAIREKQSEIDDLKFQIDALESQIE